MRVDRPASAPMRQKSGTEKAPAEKVIKDIRRVTRKLYGAEEKIRIVLEGLQGEESIAALCRREEIAESQLSPGRHRNDRRWRGRCRNSAASVRRAWCDGRSADPREKIPQHLRERRLHPGTGHSETGRDLAAGNLGLPHAARQGAVRQGRLCHRCLAGRFPHLRQGRHRPVSRRSLQFAADHQHGGPRMDRLVAYRLSGRIDRLFPGPGVGSGG